MLFDPNCDALSLELPFLPDPSQSTEEHPLSFDDLLDIAHEFEFTHTITHVWPSEEPAAIPDASLEDLLSVILPRTDTEECLPTRDIDPILVQEVDLRNPASLCPAPNAITDQSIVRNNAHNAPTTTNLPITSRLQGWSPPNGSQFLDLDDSLMVPNPLANDLWIPPWLATLLGPSFVEHADDINTIQSVSAIEVRPQTSEHAVSIADDFGTKNIPPLSLPAPHPNVPEPVRAPSTPQTNPRRPVKVSHPRPQRPRPHPPPVPLMTSATSTARYARPPRGGIPPHIARSVTKANVLRVEKERSVVRDAFSTTTAGQGKKPSVLGKASKVDKEASKTANGNGSGKKLVHSAGDDEKDRRAAKRPRV